MPDNINNSNYREKGWKTPNKKSRKDYVIIWGIAAALLWTWYTLTKNHNPFSWEVKEYVLDSKQNSIIKILKYNILSENQRSDGVLCYKLAKFVMKDNNISNPRKITKWTSLKFDIDEINKIIEEHEKLKIKNAKEKWEDGLDIYEDWKKAENSEDEELQNMISNDVYEEDENEIDNAIKNKSENLPENVENMKCKWWEYFWIDISHHNKRLDLDKLLLTNRVKWDSKKPDIRGMSFVYMRSADGMTKDRLCKQHTNVIRKYNRNKDVIAKNEKIAVWYYHRINLAWTWEQQWKLFLELYNKDKWITGWNTLIPMLVFEWKWLKMIKREDAKLKALNWLNTVEKWTGIKPWLYITPYIYQTYFAWDQRFKDYPLWIATYPPMKNGKEIWPSPRIQFKTGAVNVSNSLKNQPKRVYPACYQSSQQWKIPWTGNWDWYTDIDHSKNMNYILSEKNKSYLKKAEIVNETINTRVKSSTNKWNNVNKKKNKVKRRMQNQSKKNQRKKRK